MILGFQFGFAIAILASMALGFLLFIRGWQLVSLIPILLIGFPTTCVLTAASLAVWPSYVTSEGLVYVFAQWFGAYSVIPFFGLLGVLYRSHPSKGVIVVTSCLALLRYITGEEAFPAVTPHSYPEITGVAFLVANWFLWPKASDVLETRALASRQASAVLPNATGEINELEPNSISHSPVRHSRTSGVLPDKIDPR